VRPRWNGVAGRLNAASVRSVEPSSVMRLPRFARVLLLFLALPACEIQECDDEETGADGVCLKSLKRFEANSITQYAEYTSDIDVYVNNPNGELRVVRGDRSDRLEVTFEPFVLRAHDTPREEAEQQLDELEVSLGQSGRGLFVDVNRPAGSPGTLGADVRVALPTSFASVLDITQGNGGTRVDFVGDSPSLILTSENGDCDLTAGYAEHISVHCDNGDLRASVLGIAPQSGSGFGTGNGSIELSFPSDGVFSVQAQAVAGGSVISDVPSSCLINAASEAAKTVSCNGASDLDPVYSAVADGTGLADVVLSF
jgi:hypothetical protein